MAEIPIFCYHNALPGLLERDLAFLSVNGYQTLLASEVVDILNGAAPPAPRCVALTFDDGLLSLRTVGLPLFEEHGVKATVFAITGLVPEGTVEPSGDSAEVHRLMGWGDLAELHASGLVEIGSHGHRHNPVHVATDDGGPLDVVSYRRLYDVPVPYQPSVHESAIRAEDGRPQRPSLPLFEARELFMDGEVVDATGPILDDLAASRRLLHDRLGVERFHLCLPYGAGNERIPELAREAGFESVFWSRREDRSFNRTGDDPFRIVRRKYDHVRRMPGKGRRSWAGLMIHKVVRRLRSDPWL